MTILVCDLDPDKEREYDLKKIIKDSNFPDAEIVDLPDTKKASEYIKENPSIDLMIISYKFNDPNKLYELMNLAREHRSIPSIFLYYPAHIGISKRVKDYFSACVYKNDAQFCLAEIINNIIKK